MNVCRPVIATLTQPLMLTGLVLAVVPLLIHLFFRHRYQEVRWAAVLFLDGAVRKHARRHQIRQWLLLLLRTLAIVALVVAFARPVSTIFRTNSRSGTRTHHIVVLDSSLSMQQRRESQTRFDRGIHLIRSIVQTAPQGDTFQVVTISGRSAEAVIGRPSANREEVQADVGGLRCGFARGRPRAALNKAIEFSANHGNKTTCRVYVISDFQSSQWGGSAVGAVRTALSALAEKSQLFLLRTDGEPAANASIHDVSATQLVARVGEPAVITALVRNHSPRAITGCPVRLSVDGRVVGTQTADLEPLGQATITFSFVPRSPGHRRLAAELDSDDLTADDSARGVLTVASAVPVLLVNGLTTGRPLGNAHDFLHLSLSDAAEKERYRLRVVSDAALSTVDLNAFRAVFFCNVRQFTADEANRIRDYARAGGAVTFLLGSNVDQENYNNRLFRTDRLMPVRLDGRVGNAAAPTKALTFDTRTLDHPLMQIYRGNPGALEHALTFEYVRLTPTDPTAVRTVLRLSGGDPAVLESRFGSGRVCVIGLAADTSRWSTWNTASGVFASFSNELTEYLIAGHDEFSRLTVGETFSAPVSHFGEGSLSARLNDRDIAVRRVDSESGPRMVIDGIDEPGFLTTTNDVCPLLAANVDPGESDLRSLGEDTLRNELSPSDSDFVYADAATFEPAVNRQLPGNRNPLPVMLLFLVAVLLVAELLLAGSARRSAWLSFAGLTAAALAWVGFPAARPAVAIIATVMVAGAFLLRRR